MDDQNYIVFNDQSIAVEAKILTAINDRRVDICNCSVYEVRGYWKTYNMEQIAKNIKQWKAQDLELWSNTELKILSHIVDIKFHKLDVINLRHNGIQSVENISRVYMPLLRMLLLCRTKCDIEKNHISDIRAMKKAFWPVISQIWIQTNKIRTCESVIEFESVDIVTLDSTFNHQSEDFRFMIKLNRKRFQSLVIFGEERIRQIAAEKCLKNKWEGMSIHVKR